MYKCTMTQNLEFLSGYTNIIVNSAIILITILNCVVYKFRQDQEAETVEEDYRLKSLSTQGLCNRFSLDQMMRATSNFHDELVIGRGGFGKVYKGTLEHGLTVAIKRLQSMSRQGSTEFQTEIQMLSKLRHSHLVSLIGYCDEGCEMILVYEFMPGGTLADHLYRRDRNGDKSLAPLSWVQRLKICIGAARGLDYLHTGTGIKHRIIHRDVKTTNILLDDYLEAKISDFGLSKTSPANQTITFVSTHVKGTFGYFDPYYFLTHRLTWRSDVYSFGVVLFEVLCGRPAVDRTLGEEQIGLAGWAQHCSKEGTLEQIIDSRIKGDVFSDSLEAFVRVAIQCLQFGPKHRPNMAEIVVSLESALALQGKSTEYYLPEIIISDEEHEAIDSSEIEAKNENSEEGMVDVSINRHQEKQSSAIKRFVAFLTIRARAMSVNKDSNNGFQNKKDSNNGVVLLPGNKMTSYGSEKKVFANNGGGDSDRTTASYKSELVFFDRKKQFQLADLLRASAEKIGKGSLGTVYKAVLDDGITVAVKSLKGSNPYERKEFEQYLDVIGRLKHANVVRLRAFYYSKEEKLLVYDYLPNGSLYSLLHGKRGHGRIPLDWTTRICLVLGAARGLARVHEEYEAARIPHGNVKSSNVLLDRNCVACIADFGLASFLNPLLTTSRLGGYRAPEQVEIKSLSQKADVYSFGVLLLEVLTGRAPSKFSSPASSHPLAEEEEQVVDLPKWVRSVVRNEWTAEVFDQELLRYKNIEEELLAMLHVAMACVVPQPEKRPSMSEVAKLIEEIRVEQSPLGEEYDESHDSRHLQLLQLKVDH